MVAVFPLEDTNVCLYLYSRPPPSQTNSGIFVGVEWVSKHTQGVAEKHSKKVPLEVKLNTNSVLSAVNCKKITFCPFPSVDSKKSPPSSVRSLFVKWRTNLMNFLWRVNRADSIALSVWRVETFPSEPPCWTSNPKHSRFLFRQAAFTGVQPSLFTLYVKSDRKIKGDNKTV